MDDDDDFEAEVWVDPLGPSTSKAAHKRPALESASKSKSKKTKPDSDEEDDVYGQDDDAFEDEESDAGSDEAFDEDEEEEEKPKPKAKAAKSKGTPSKAATKKPAAATKRKPAATKSAPVSAPSKAASSIVPAPMSRRKPSNVTPVTIPGGAALIRRVGLSKSAPARPISPVRIPPSRFTGTLN